MPSLTLSELKERTAALYWRKQKAAAKSESVADLVVGYFGKSLPVAKIDHKAINTYRLDMAKAGSTPATINRKLAALSKMLHLAADEGSIRQVPKIHRERETGGRERFVTRDEEAKLLATLKVWGCPEEHDLVLFLIDTGARLGEALTLRWTAVQAERVTFLGTKNGENRTVPLTWRLRMMIQCRESEQRTDNTTPLVGLVFPGKSRGIQKMWTRVRRHLKLQDDPNFVIHILRHTCASRLLQGGANLEYVRQWLGHKSLKVTQRYAHLAPTSLDALTKILEQQPEEKPRHLGVVKGGITAEEGGRDA